MAFNPLRSMRKHQKVLMSALVIVIMFIFILSSGSQGGDFFDWLRGALGGRQQFPEVATLYGDRVDTQELARVRNQRLVAHQYMVGASQAVLNHYENHLKRLAEEGKKQPGNMAAFREQDSLQTKAAEIRQRIGTGRPYFGGGFDAHSLLDFLIWKRQADRLGIQLDQASMMRDVDQDMGLELTRDMLRFAEQSAIQNSRTDRMTKDLLVTALTDEFRVRLAKAALLGPDAPAPRQNQFGMNFGQPQSGRLQTAFTPHEFWEFFRKSRTEISVRLLPVAARDLLAQVKDTPTDEELHKLFEKHDKEEPNPAQKTPGFKQPRRIQVEWVSANANEEPYPRAAELSLAVLEATMPLAFYDHLFKEYGQSKFRFRLPGWTEEQSGKALLPAYKQPDFELTHRLNALPVAGATDAVLAAVLGSYQAREVAQDLKDLGDWVEKETKARKEFLASALVLTGLPSPPLMLTGVPALSVAARQHAGDRSGQHLPLQVVKRYLFKNLREDTARRLVRSNLDTFRKEVEKLRTRPEDVKKYVAETAPRFGLKQGGMAQPRDQHTLFDDSAMQPLKEPLRDSFRFIAQFQGPRELAAMLDDDPRGRILSHFVFMGLSKTYSPQDTLRGETTYVYWTTTDKPAYVPKFDEVKDQVVEAWRLAKARELAKKEAEQVAEDAKKGGGDALRRLVDGSPHSGKLIDLYGVTRLKPPEQSPLPGRDRQYTPYRLPRGEIEFPTPDFVDKLLELKGYGDVTVLHDYPETTYYVVAPLAPRTEPVPGEFYAIYKRSTPLDFIPDPLMGQFDQVRRAEQRGAVMEQLRAEARLKLNEEGLKAVAEER